MKILLIYIILINIIAIYIMYNDKKSAIKHEWRTPEKHIFLIAIILGSPGIISGMYLFRHKTKHMKFVILIPLILVIQLGIFLKFFIN